jgi:hypothetical protein
MSGARSAPPAGVVLASVRGLDELLNYHSRSLCLSTPASSVLDQGSPNTSTMSDRESPGCGPPPMT